VPPRQAQLEQGARCQTDQRRHLEETADRAAWVKPGDVIEPFVLPEVLGGTIDLAELLADGPVVLLFFRLANCPACNIPLRHYQQELYPALAEFGAALVAISPQVPEKLAAIRNRFGFAFPVASDSDCPSRARRPRAAS
jgi:peroxiredoxin